MYRDQDFGKIISELKNVNYWWFVLMFFISILSHISRTMRWQMLIRSYGGNSGFLNTFLAVMNGYFANLAIPRLGEVTRCALSQNMKNNHFQKYLGLW